MIPALLPPNCVNEVDWWPCGGRGGMLSRSACGAEIVVASLSVVARTVVQVMADLFTLCISNQLNFTLALSISLVAVCV